MKIYLASPLGFSEAGQLGLISLKSKLKGLGHEVLDPWDADFTGSINRMYDEENDYGTVLRMANAIAERIGKHNHNLIEEADCVLAVLDGQELDSGTVAELAYAVGRSKEVHGYRGDFRNLGELPGIPFNLQVWFFLKASGGKLFRSIDEIDI